MWQTPKTNWEIKPRVNGLYNGDWFNCADYERIAGNLVWLRTVGQTLYGVTIPLVAMRTFTVVDFPRASDFQTLEDNLYALISLTYTPAVYSGKRIWKDNGPTPTVDDLNRIEGSTAELRSKFLTLGARVSYVTSDGNMLLTSDNDIYKVWEVA